MVKYECTEVVFTVGVIVGGEIIERLDPLTNSRFYVVGQGVDTSRLYQSSYYPHRFTAKVVQFCYRGSVAAHMLYLLACLERSPYASSLRRVDSGRVQRGCHRILSPRGIAAQGENSLLTRSRRMLTWPAA